MLHINHLAGKEQLLSIFGSISSNDKGGLYLYRSSKTALNAITKSLSVDLVKDWIIACSVHPGWVQTDMGGPIAPVTIKESVQGMLKLFNSFDKNSYGSFFSIQWLCIELVMLYNIISWDMHTLFHTK